MIYEVKIKNVRKDGLFLYYEFEEPIEIKAGDYCVDFTNVELPKPRSMLCDVKFKGLE